MSEAVIVGVGIHKYGRFENETFEQLGQTAVRMALKDAGMSFKDVQAAFCGTMNGGTSVGHRTLVGIGLTGIPIVNLEAACASGAFALKLAAEGIEAGRYDVALAFGAEKMPRGFMVMTSFTRWQMLSGLGINPIGFALNATRHMAMYGTTEAQLAKVAVKNHKNSQLNPYAMYQRPISFEEIMNSRMVCYPLRLLMLCAPDEGAAAVLLCKKEIAHRYTTHPVHLSSVQIGVAQYGNTDACNDGLSSRIERSNPTPLVANKAYNKAGIGPEDLSLVELQDTDSASEIIYYEQLGLCQPGEGGRMIDEGQTEMGGKIPVSVSGGLLSKGEPVGASALGQVVEVVWQLRGQAGPRQVKDAKAGLCHVTGAGGNAAVTILRR